MNQTSATAEHPEFYRLIEKFHLHWDAYRSGQYNESPRSAFFLADGFLRSLKTSTVENRDVPVLAK